LARGCHRILGIFVQDLNDLKPLEALVADAGCLAESLKLSDSTSVIGKASYRERASKTEFAESFKEQESLLLSL
jgi:hypothetical protein